mmetsp:Transcript_1740/g.5300  ORF Transcript_1740/g.5300 Transcript_1740/m.5300 type:complete len:328 (-) Transcript_1740:411-1394(-)
MLGRGMRGFDVWSKLARHNLSWSLSCTALASRQLCLGGSGRSVHSIPTVELASFIPKRIGDIKDYTSKPITFILHGMLGSSYNWRSLLVREDFLPGRYVCALDLRNHGRSQHASSMLYDEMCEDVLGFANGLGAEKLSLIGHSMGGKVAMNMALKYPDKLASLVVVDIAPVEYSSSSMHLSILDAMANLDLNSITSVAQARDLLSKEIPDQETREFILTNLTQVQETKKFKWKVNVQSIREGVKNGELKKFNVDSNLTYDGPTLFVRGGRSKYVQDVHFDTIRRFFPNSRVETVENAGHWIHHESPEELNRILNDWFQEIAPQEKTT